MTEDLNTLREALALGSNAAYDLGHYKDAEKISDAISIVARLEAAAVTDAETQQFHADLIASVKEMRAARPAVPVGEVKPPKLWLWKNFVDGKPEYWAFNNAFPVYPDSDDPQTLGEPCGYALVKPSRAGRRDVSEDEVLRRIAATPPAPIEGWRPIETAPKDGTQIILTNGKTVAQGWWEHQEPFVREKRGSAGVYLDQQEHDGFDDWLDCEGGMLPNPTHWMPLPAAPQPGDKA